MNFFLIISLILLANFSLSEKTTYDGYKLVILTVKDKALIEKVHSFEEYDTEYDVWGVKQVGDEYSLTVMLSPKVVQKYLNIFKSLNVNFEIAHHNVQALFDYQESTMMMNKVKGRREIINTFARYNEIDGFVKDIVAAHPDLVSYYYPGDGSVEKRKIIVAKFKTDTSKKGLWIDCGIHAREWVTPATCVYIINQIVKEYKDGVKDTVDLLNKYEIHVLPLLNPDGYEFTFTDRRLWRKNRADTGLIGSLCKGVDLNRNFDFKWNQGGTSDLTCSDIYAGPKGNSEPETKTLLAALQAKNDWDAYYSIHSYGQWWLLPWGHSPNEVAPNYNDLYNNGMKGADAIKAVNGSVFTVGSSSALLYVTTGSSADYAYGVLNIPFSATLELRPGNTTADASYGFELPEDRLPLVTEETWAGIKASMVDVSARRP